MSGRKTETSGATEREPDVAGCFGASLIAVALLVTGLIRFLICVCLEVPLFGVVFVMGTVTFAFAHTLSVRFISRIILVVEKWSAGSLRCHSSADTPAHS